MNDELSFYNVIVIILKLLNIAPCIMSVLVLASIRVSGSICVAECICVSCIGEYSSNHVSGINIRVFVDAKG